MELLRWRLRQRHRQSHLLLAAEERVLVQPGRGLGSQQNRHRTSLQQGTSRWPERIPSRRKMDVHRLCRRCRHYHRRNRRRILRPLQPPGQLSHHHRLDRQQPLRLRFRPHGYDPLLGSCGQLQLGTQTIQHPRPLGKKHVCRRVAGSGILSRGGDILALQLVLLFRTQ